MSERDELTHALAAAYGESPSSADEDAAEAILAAGYRKPQQITTVEELDALPEGTLIACTQANPNWPDVFLHTGNSLAPWLHLDPSDREDGEMTTTSGAVLRWHGNGSVAVLHVGGTALTRNDKDKA